MDGLPRDEQGRVVFGLNACPCPFCGSEPVYKVSACGRVKLVHTPVECCDRQWQARDPHGFRARRRSSA